MNRNRFTFQRLKERCGGRVEDVIERLGLSNNNAMYRLKNPLHYGFPEAVFDRRSDLAERIARAAGVHKNEVVAYYLAIWKEYKGEDASR